MSFLSATYPLNGWLHNWSINRLGDWRFGGNAIRAKTDLNFFVRNVHIWEHEGKVIGFLVAEYGDLMFLQVHPHHRAMSPRWCAGPRSLGQEPEEGDLRGFRGGRLASGRARGTGLLSRRAVRYDPEVRLIPLRRTASNPTWIQDHDPCDFGDEDSYIEAVRTSFDRDLFDREWFDSKVQAPGYSHQWNICVISPQNRVVSFADVRIDQKGVTPRSIRSGPSRTAKRKDWPTPV